MQASTKELIAIGICLTSAVGAIAAVRMGWKLTHVMMGLALIWSCTGRWVSRLPRFWHRNFRELFATARRGDLVIGRRRLAEGSSWVWSARYQFDGCAVAVCAGELGVASQQRRLERLGKCHIGAVVGGERIA